MGLGLIARSQGLLVVEALPEQTVARLEPNTFDLGIALAAGAIATYAKVNPGAVSSIAVALVPPVCVMGERCFPGQITAAPKGLHCSMPPTCLEF